MMKQHIKNLWKLCFNDSEAFIDLYFRLRYNDEVNIAIESGDEVIAALQMLPYPMTFGGKTIQTAYVSGACTHPDYRGRGVMHELLAQSFTRMLHNDIALSTLIPAEPWLFGYYERHGYAPVFNRRAVTFTASPAPEADERYALKVSNEYKAKSYEFLNRKLGERPYCIQHTEKDYRVILADLRLGQGYVCTLHDKDRIAALAVVHPTPGNTWNIAEIVSDGPEAHVQLLSSICRKLEIASVEVTLPPTPDEAGQPLGMARVINAKPMLQLYAAAHPETEICIDLTDEQLSVNNGYYYLNNGRCMSSAKRLPGSHLALTISELTAKIFETSNPCMSLMLN